MICAPGVQHQKIATAKLPDQAAVPRWLRSLRQLEMKNIVSCVEEKIRQGNPCAQ
jgi:hypothetical protein